MTPNELLLELKKFLEASTKDLILQVRPVNNKVIPKPNGESNENEEQPKERAPEVHLMNLPNKDAETNRIPYILVQFLTGIDEQKAGEAPDSECKVRIVIATYSDDKSVGAMDCLNVITRIRIALHKAGVIGGKFFFREPLEYLVYPDDTEKYHLGEMMTTWGIPTIQREVNLYGEE